MALVIIGDRPIDELGALVSATFGAERAERAEGAGAPKVNEAAATTTADEAATTTADEAAAEALIHGAAEAAAAAGGEHPWV